MIEPPLGWQELLAELKRAPPWRSIFIVGPMGSGKTTFCRFLGGQLAQREPTAAVDCDPGQSALGPPTTLGLAREPWRGEKDQPLALWFIGATSPAGHFLPMVTGTKRLAERAWAEGATKLVLDSSGYPAVGAGFELHYHTLDLLQPDHLVALQGVGELEPLLANFTRRAKPQIHRLSISEAVVPRSRAQRRAYREQRWKSYFNSAREQRLPLKRIGFNGRVPERDDPGSYRKRLVGLCDRSGFAAVVGIVEGMDAARAELRLFAPRFDPGQITSVRWGTTRVDRAGREL